MVYCPACGQEQDDSTSFCRFCGDPLPGEQLMLRLREEALKLASVRQGKHLTDAQRQNADTIRTIEHNKTSGGPGQVHNVIHAQAAQQATQDLKSLMRGFE